MKNTKKLIPALIVGGIGIVAGATCLTKKIKKKESKEEIIDLVTNQKLELLETFINEEDNELTDIGEIILRKFIAGVKDKIYKANPEDFEKIITENEFSIFGIYSTENFERIFDILTFDPEK